MEKTVIASAARRIGRRQLARERRRIAETMVPEWESPTQKTKPVLESAHMTGRFLPVTYMPWLTCQVKAASPQATTPPSRMTSSHQRRLGGPREERSWSFSSLAVLVSLVREDSDMLAASSLEIVDRRVC